SIPMISHALTGPHVPNRNHVRVPDGVADAYLRIHIRQNRHFDWVEGINPATAPIGTGIRPREIRPLLEQCSPCGWNKSEAVEQLVEDGKFGDLADRGQNVISSKSRITGTIKEKPLKGQRIKSMGGTS